MAKTEVSARKRQPKGIPVGGQFAENAHDEASSSLADPGTTTTARGTVLEKKLALTPKELLAEARKAVSVYGERKRLTPDEQEEAVMASVEEIWKTYGSKDKDIPGAVVNHVARIQVGKTIRGGQKALVGDNAMAWSQYQSEIETIEKETGRQLSQRERDEIAESIRETWHDQSHKPTQGYHLHGTREQSINALPGSYDVNDEYVHPAIIDPYSPEDALMSSGGAEADKALERLELASVKEADSPVSGPREKASNVQRELRARAWEIVSTDAGAPPVQAKLPAAMRKTASAIVKAEGGVSAIIAKFDRGEEDRSTEALFLPFRATKTGDGGRFLVGKISESDKEEIADVLRRNPKMADALWASAVASAK